VRVVLGVAVAVLTLDIVSKTIVVATLSSRNVRLLGGLLTLTQSRNPGAAFSLGGPSETIIFSAIAVGVAVYIIRAARRIYSTAWAVALGLLLGGATGNLTDRIFRSPGPFRGWVVDWIELPHWPVFNLADSAITCGGVLMVVLAVLGHGIEGRAGAAASRAAAAQPTLAEPATPEATLAEPATPESAAAEPATPEWAAAEPAAGEATAAEPATPAAPELTAAELTLADPATPGPPGAETQQQPVAQGGQEQSAAEQPQSGWPEPGQPRSGWPRSQWPEPGQPQARRPRSERPETGQSGQEHPARGSTG
jgi:signal peptidase II